MAEIIEKELYGGSVVIHFYPNSHQYKLVRIDGEALPKKENINGVTSFTGLIDKSRVLMKWAVGQYTTRATELLEEGNYTRDDVLRILELSQNHYEETKQKAADVGTYVHKFCEEYSKDLDAAKAYERSVIELGVPDDAMKRKIDDGVQGFVRWVEDKGIKILSAENLIFSQVHRYTGTYDAIIEIDGKKYLADYKTSNGIYNEHYYQTSAYVNAYEEEHGTTLDGALIVAIAKEDKNDRKAGEITTEFRTREQIDADFQAFVGLIALKKREKELQADWRNKNK